MLTVSRKRVLCVKSHHYVDATWRALLRGACRGPLSNLPGQDLLQACHLLLEVHNLALRHVQLGEQVVDPLRRLPWLTREGAQ